MLTRHFLKMRTISFLLATLALAQLGGADCRAATPVAIPTSFFPQVKAAPEAPKPEPTLLKDLVEIAEQTSHGASIGATVRAIASRNSDKPYLQLFSAADLMANWHTVSEFGLATPENLERMRAGKNPLVTVGGLRGQGTTIVPAAVLTGGPGKTYRLIPLALLQTIAPPIDPPPANYHGMDIFRGRQMNGLSVRFVEVAPGENAKLKDLIGAELELRIDSADQIKGISYSVIDPTQSRLKSVVNERGNIGMRETIETTADVAHWIPTIIPWATEQGIYLTELNSYSIYLSLPRGIPGERYRIAVVKGSKPAPERPRTTEIVDVKFGEAINLLRFRKMSPQFGNANAAAANVNYQFVILTAKLHEGVTFLLSPGAQQQAAMMSAHPGQPVVGPKPSKAAWGDYPIPDTKLTGMLVTNYLGVEIYYVNAGNVDRDSCRVCVRYDAGVGKAE